MNKTCETCNCIDDEEHRLNTYPKWENNNCSLGDNKVPFINVYLNDYNVLRDILPHIEKLWDTKNANGTMRKWTNQPPVCMSVQLNFLTLYGKEFLSSKKYAGGTLDGSCYNL